MTVFGLRGHESRCFNNFQKVMECRSNVEYKGPSQCLPLEAEYDECLHRRHERRKNRRVRQQIRKADGEGEVHTVARQVGLGLVDKEYTYADFKKDGGKWPMWLTSTGVKEPKPVDQRAPWWQYTLGLKKETPSEK